MGGWKNLTPFDGLSFEAERTDETKCRLVTDTAVANSLELATVCQLITHFTAAIFQRDVTGEVFRGF